MINRFHPVDIVAITFILVGAFLKLRGADGEVALVMALIAGYYFGRRENDPRKDNA